MASSATHRKHIEVRVVSEDYSSDDGVWQLECRSLFTALNRQLDAGNLEPLQLSEAEGDRGGLLELFHQFTASGLTLAAFETLVLVVKNWLGQRASCEVKLVLPDGTETAVSGLSPEQAVALWERLTSV